LPKAQSYSYHFSEQPAHEVPGGSVKIVDPLTFPIASNFSAALVTVKPGALREIHWHPSSDEWSFFIQGQGRGTLFAAPDTATTFDFRAGDVAYFPKSHSHYIENTGDIDLIFVEVLQADHFSGALVFIRYANRTSVLTRTVYRRRPRPVDRLDPAPDHPRHAEAEQRDGGQLQEGEAIRRPGLDQPNFSGLAAATSGRQPECIAMKSAIWTTGM